MAKDYKHEPHWRPENVALVDAKINKLVRETHAKRAMDLGCGTGFMINLLKKYVPSIVGVDATQAMLDEVDRSGSADIKLLCHDTGTLDIESGSFDLVTCYSFLHHLYDITPTLNVASKALRPGGKFYADLEPNRAFWQQIEALDESDSYDSIIQNEIKKLKFQDGEVAEQFGISPDLLNKAEYGKNVKGGFDENELRNQLMKAGFKKIEFQYYWYVGQADVINSNGDRTQSIALASEVDKILQRIKPLSRVLFKYIGFVATK